MKGTIGLHNPSHWHISQLQVCMCTQCVWCGRVQLSSSALCFTFPVWQHLITEANSTRKSGRTFVSFSQLNIVEMEWNISWLCYDTMTQNTALDQWISIVLNKFWYIWEQTSLTCLWLWCDNASGGGWGGLIISINKCGKTKMRTKWLYCNILDS